MKPSNSTAKSAYVAWGAVALGITARFAWVLLGPSAVENDAAAYRMLAHSLARGAGYATDSGPSAFWVPGWPAWMALFYVAHAGDLAIALGSVGLGMATIAATYALARRAHGPAVARVAAAIVALWPSLILLPKALLSENLALPCFMAGVLSLVWAAADRSRGASPWRWLVAGLVCGGAVLVRQACAALLVAGWFLPIRRRAILPLTAWAAFVIAMWFVLAPWIARNRDAMGSRRLTTSGGVNLCIGFGEGATGGYRQLDDYALPGADPRGTNREVARQDAGRRCAMEGIARHPLSPLTLVPAKLSRLLVWDDWIIDDVFGPRLSASTATVLRVACNGPYWIILALAVFGTSPRRLMLNVASRANALTLLVVVASVLASFGNARFHVLMQPLLAVFAARGAFALRARF